jgi:hypothetical protein
MRVLAASPANREICPMKLSRFQIVVVIYTLFAVSLAFPVIASLGSGGFYGPWFGIADVAIAVVLIGFTLVSGVFATRPTANSALTSLFVLRTGSNIALVLLVVFLLFHEIVRWNILLPGLAWRMWLFVQVLPGLVARSADDLQ